MRTAEPEADTGRDPATETDRVPHDILLVEDERSIAESVIYALKSEGFAVAWAQTGAEGLRVVKSGRPALVVLDIGLPDVNGFELCKQIRQASEVPIVFLTARAEEVDRIVGLELGADDYMAKPFSPRELTARIRAILRRLSPKPPAEPTETGPFRHDAARYRIEYHGIALELSRYEYRLLKTLLDRPGVVFTREQLMDKVWEHPEHSLDRTVDTHIKTLRSKLRAIDPAGDVIRTHRGIGYSLELAK